jgi:NADH-quinone oxidoreductase subunit H
VDWPFIIASVIKIIVFALAIVMLMVAYSVYAERRVSAAIQDRVGPNRVGLPLTLFGAKKDFPLAGLFQPMADGIKFLLKEDFTPGHVNKFYYWLAPALVLIPALLTCAVLPFGSELNLSFLGGVRSTSQMISYELSMGLSLVPLLLIYSQLNLGEIVRFQDANGWLVLPLWGEGLSWERWVLLIPVLISFLIFTTSIFAETNRTPFDLPECETELVAGYHTEYSSMKFALFFMGEYAAMIVGSGLIVTLFFGGWSIPFAPVLGLAYEAGNTPFWLGLLHIACFLAKVVVFIIFFIFVRWTIPRFRYDKLMDLGWKIFFEVALVNIFVTALIIWFFNRN